MPSHEKASFKSEVIRALGAEVEDAAEAATKAEAMAIGAKNAAEDLHKKLIQLAANVDAELDEGKISMDEASLVKRWLARTQAVASSMAVSYAAKVEQSKGFTLGLRRAVSILEARWKEELAKLAAPERPGPPGETPEERREARRAEKAARKAERSADGGGDGNGAGRTPKKTARKVAKKRTRKS